MVQNLSKREATNSDTHKWNQIKNKVELYGDHVRHFDGMPLSGKKSKGLSGVPWDSSQFRLDPLVNWTLMNCINFRRREAREQIQLTVMSVEKLTVPVVGLRCGGGPRVPFLCPPSSAGTGGSRGTHSLGSFKFCCPLPSCLCWLLGNYL